ncbi:MAG: hypothetical protein ACKVOP_06955, partial [Sphingomonadaceae bacterium]
MIAVIGWRRLLKYVADRLVTDEQLPAFDGSDRHIAGGERLAPGGAASLICSLADLYIESGIVGQPRFAGAQECLCEGTICDRAVDVEHPCLVSG